MSEQQITIVRDNSSSEVKVFVGGELRGRYKDDSTALAHLATALVELTAAQQRVAELERECESMRGLLQASRVSSDRDMREKCSIEAENARLLKRVDDLEVAVANGMNDATRFVDRNGWLESEHERLKQENERLRGLLRECLKYLPLKGTTYNAMACQDSKLEDRIKAELGSE